MQRLKKRSQFQAVMAGEIIVRTKHFALHCVKVRQTEQTHQFPVDDVWVGAMIPKRWAKRAVMRNTIKRQIYEMYKRFEKGLPNAAYVVRLKMGYTEAEFPSATSQTLKSIVRHELEKLLCDPNVKPAFNQNT